MHKLRPRLSLVLFNLVTWASCGTLAAGLGSGGGPAVLGQPLDFVVQVRLDGNEPDALDCVAAEVTLGERKLPPPLVQAAVVNRSADSARIRVVTLQVVDEPVIEIRLSAGCQSRISRRYVVLADPPIGPLAGAQADPSALPPVPSAAPSTLATAPVPASAGGPGPGSPSVASTGASAVASAGGPSTAGIAAAAPRRSAAARSAPRADRKAPVRKAERRPPPAAKASRAAAPADPSPRLQLEMVAPQASAERLAVEEAIAAVAQAASAAREAASAASANAARLASMERMVEQLRGEAKASRDLAAQLRTRLMEADQSSRWTLPLLVLALLLASLASWLAWRLSVMQRERQQVWQAAALAPQPAAAAPEPVATGFVTAEDKPTQPAHHAPARDRARSAPAWPPPAPAAWAGETTQALPPPAVPGRRGTSPAAPEPAVQRTEVLPAQAQIEEGAARDVSIEELIDLEQQAEFFVVLGQDESAVELLNEHIRSTGGGSPLPYLKLLEIHHRRGERKSYESIRTRFNHHFNAYAPEWGADLGSGRSLSDYSGVLPRLQQVWARPLDAMAELEALLFRKSRGDLFDLPAYREVLFLYALARDLMDREAVGSEDVDLLLPMADGSEFSTTAPAPYLTNDRSDGRLGPDEHPTLPLDFDLSAMDRPASIFDPLDDPTTRPAERG